MERSTVKTAKGWALAMPGPYATEDDAKADLLRRYCLACERLAAYEDTGLEPEEVVAVKNAFMGREIAKITEFDGISIERLQELVQAEEEGRLVVLPCKADVELQRHGHICRADHWNHLLTAFRDAPDTRTGYQVELFSIEEAKAALKKEGTT